MTYVRTYDDEGDELYSGTAIGVVAADGPPSWEFLIALLNLEYKPDTFAVDTPEVGGSDAARNRLVRGFLHNTSCLSLLLIESDVILPPKTLKDVDGFSTGLAHWDKPIVSALVPQCRPPYAPMWYSEHLSEKTVHAHGKRAPWHNALMKLVTERGHFGIEVLDDHTPLGPVAHLSTHCLLIEREVFRYISPPWFGGFFKKAIGEGFIPYLDTNVMVGHKSATMLDSVTWNYFRGGKRNAKA